MDLLKTARQIIKYTFITVSVIIFGLFLFYFSPSIWRHYITYPKLEKERANLWASYKKTNQYILRDEYKGLMHSHNYWSHDSRGTLPEILYAAKKAKLNFIFFSDHAHGKLDTFPRSFHGTFEGIILESGTESGTGLMVNPFDSIVLDWNKDENQLIKEVVSNGGMVTYVHTEKKHRWKNPDYQAMEIYNIHTDLLDEDSILPFVINSIVNGNKYLHWGFRELYDDQTAILANWDRLNMDRQIVGICAVDAHNNNNFRARYHEDGKVEWVGPNADRISLEEPNWLDNILLGETDEFGWAFKWEMDPYFSSFNYVNNHVFCDTFSNVNIKENILKGHVFISFESLAEAKGFQFFSTNDKNELSAILGDSVAVEHVKSLKAVSPFPVKYQLYRNGKIFDEKENVYEYDIDIQNKAGNYRIVASLKLNGQWISWVFTNPIYVY